MPSSPSPLNASISGADESLSFLLGCCLLLYTVPYHYVYLHARFTDREQGGYKKLSHLQEEAVVVQSLSRIRL